jgi:hypothetical protein
MQSYWLLKQAVHTVMIGLSTVKMFEREVIKYYKLSTV